MPGNGMTEEFAAKRIVGLLHGDEGLYFEGYPLVGLVVEVDEVWGVMCRLFVYHFLDYVTGAALFLLRCQVLLIVLLDVRELWDDQEVPAAALEVGDEARAGEDVELVCYELLYL